VSQEDPREPHLVGIGPNKACAWCGRSDYCLSPLLCYLHLKGREIMSCKACDEFQKSDKTSYYRFGIANLEIRACEEHLKEVFDTLNRAQTEGVEGGGNDLKYGPLNIPGIPPNEPVFVLRAQDAHSVYLLQEYQALVGSHSTDMKDAMELSLRRFKAWPNKKLPD